MYIKKRYSVKAMIFWTRKETLLFLLIALIPTLFFDLLDLEWLRLPWLPVALIGTAVAFIIGFQNNVTYDRIWEARKIWGEIVNSSRTWTMMVQDMVTNEYAETPASEEELQELRKTLVYRHLGWLTALRFAMRQPRTWEVFLKYKTNTEWYDRTHIPERDAKLEDELQKYLSPEEYEYVMTKTNKPAPY